MSSKRRTLHSAYKMRRLWSIQYHAWIQVQLALQSCFQHSLHIVFPTFGIRAWWDEQQARLETPKVAWKGVEKLHSEKESSCPSSSCWSLCSLCTKWFISQFCIVRAYAGKFIALSASFEHLDDVVKSRDCVNCTFSWSALEIGEDKRESLEDARNRCFERQCDYWPDRLNLQHHSSVIYLQWSIHFMRLKS